MVRLSPKDQHNQEVRWVRSRRAVHPILYVIVIPYSTVVPDEYRKDILNLVEACGGSRVGPGGIAAGLGVVRNLRKERIGAWKRRRGRERRLTQSSGTFRADAGGSSATLLMGSSERGS